MKAAAVYRKAMTRANGNSYRETLAATPVAGFDGYRGASGETVTSTYRDPAKNRMVGGVANSYHTRRYPDGTPMARDSVPPKGMAMSAYYELLKRMNPSLQVLNEGDHIHMEPR